MSGDNVDPIECHTLTGVWVEIKLPRLCRTTLRHTLTGVWVEMAYTAPMTAAMISHTLTGVWVEIPNCWFIQLRSQVTPSRVCELKSSMVTDVSIVGLSHPHGCVSWNVCVCTILKQPCSHTLTGVWVEMTRYHISVLIYDRSHPHGCVSWNAIEMSYRYGMRIVTPSRVCELKYADVAGASNTERVTPSRVCELKYRRSYWH